MREVVCADALEWLGGQELDAIVFTSLPDAAELDMDVGEWVGWYRGALQALGQAIVGAGPLLLYQTDRREGGRLVSKAGLAIEVLAGAGMVLRRHVVCLARPVGTVDRYRPTYTHLLAFARTNGSVAPGADTVWRGEQVYPNGIGLVAAWHGIKMARGPEWRDVQLVVDPFCGRGTILAMAEALGMDALGVDIDPAQCERARQLRVSV